MIAALGLGLLASGVKGLNNTGGADYCVASMPTGKLIPPNH